MNFSNTSAGGNSDSQWRMRRGPIIEMRRNSTGSRRGRGGADIWKRCTRTGKGVAAGRIATDFMCFAGAGFLAQGFEGEFASMAGGKIRRSTRQMTRVRTRGAVAWHIAVAVGLACRTGKAAAARHANWRDDKAQGKRKCPRAKSKDESRSRLTRIHDGSFQATCSKRNGQSCRVAGCWISVQSRGACGLATYVAQ